MTEDSAALAHLRVLDLTRARAGPTCCRVLADFGADVLKIEAPAEVFADPQVEHLGIAVKCRHPVRGDVRIVGQPVSLSRTPARIRTMTPLRGEHTDAVLHELGFTADDITRLHQINVV